MVVDPVQITLEVAVSILASRFSFAPVLFPLSLNWADDALVLELIKDVFTSQY